MDQETKQKLEAIQSGVAAFQEANNSLGKKVDALATDKVAKISDDLTKMAGELQDAKMKREAQEKTILLLEKTIARTGLANGKGNEIVDQYGKQFGSYLRKGSEVDGALMDNFITDLVSNMSDPEKAFKSLRSDINPQGGYFTTGQMLAQMVKREFETSPIRNLANVIQIGGSYAEMIIDDNEAATGGWVSETSTRAESNTPEIGILKIYPHEQFAKPKATQTMLDDAIVNLESWLATKIVDILSRTENTAFVTGNGVNKPKGFLAYTAWGSQGVYERDKVEQRQTGSNDAIGADDLINLMTDLKEIYQAGATWVMKRKTWATILALKSTVTGDYLINPALIKQGTDLVLMGKPVVFADDMPAVADGTLPIAYGDFKAGYTIVDRIGVRILRDPYSAKPYVEFYTTKRTGGAVSNYEAIKILKVQ